jgi:phage gp16-like protein
LFKQADEFNNYVLSSVIADKIRRVWNNLLGPLRKKKLGKMKTSSRAVGIEGGCSCQIQKRDAAVRQRPKRYAESYSLIR